MWRTDEEFYRLAAGEPPVGGEGSLRDAHWSREADLYVDELCDQVLAV